MKTAFFAAATAALATVSEARKCWNITIPVPVKARNAVFNITAPQSNIEVTNFVLDITQQGIGVLHTGSGTYTEQAPEKNYTATILTGYKDISRTYSIASTYCQPDSGPGKYLQLLTHGIGFDRSYWDLPFNNYNYSYVGVAVEHYGYSTFTWDRTGIGMSQHGEPVNEIQQYLEVETLRSLTLLLQKGQIPGIGCKYPNIIHGGHSFGSEHTYALTAKYPDISAGIFLTGFSQNGSFVPYFALGSNLVEANSIPSLAQYPNGYFADSSSVGVQIDFFAPGQFDPNILQYATSNGQPVTAGELLTIGGETASVNTFAKPVLVITGERDIPFCGGNCYGTGGAGSSIPAMAAKTLPNAKPFQAVVVPKSGHGLNLEYSHPFSYGKINDFLAQNGLAAK